MKYLTLPRLCPSCWRVVVLRHRSFRIRFFSSLDFAVRGAILSERADQAALRNRHPVRDAETVPVRRGVRKPLVLSKSLIERVCELQCVILVKDQRRTDFQNIGARARDSHEYS